MNRFKTVVLLPMLATLVVACTQEGGKTDAGAQTGAQAPKAAPPAPAVPAVQFAVIEAPDPAGAIKVPCTIDKINAQPAAKQTVNVEAGGELRFVGWVSDASKRVPDQFTIVLAGPAIYGVTGTAGLSRPDVARVLKAPALENAGFNVLTALATVEAGEYSVSIVQTAGAKVVLCPTTTRVAVVKSPA